jgi:hypothetical protein
MQAKVGDSATPTRNRGKMHLQMRLFGAGSSWRVVVPDSACHAAGRGFESRRSRSKALLKQAFSLFASIQLSRSGKYRSSKGLSR